MSTAPAHDADHGTTRDPARVLIVGRSPNVLLEDVDLLRGKGFDADATNRFDDVLTDYDVSGIDVLVFGGMVPQDTKQHLRDEVSRRNPGVAIVQGLGGIAGLIAAQVEAVTGPDGTDPATAPAVVYDDDRRSILIELTEATHATVEAWWATSFQPPEPRSAHAVVFDGKLEPGRHAIAMPDDVPSEASFTAVRIDGSVHVFTVGAMPAAVTRLAPTSAADRRLPEVGKVATHGEPTR